MDVSCNRCGTDYEFEETLVSTRGTTVKCTSCGHLFKVFRGGTQEQTPTDDSRPWLVRRRNGDVEPLVSLGDLTRMIARSEITTEDEISRTGQAWKKLGEIAELQGFFANPKRAQAALTATPPLGLESPTGRPSRTSDAPLPIGVSSSPPVSRTEVTQPGIEPSEPAIRVTETPPSAPITPRPGKQTRPKEPARHELPKPTLTVDEPPSAQEHTPRERPSARTRAKARQSSSGAGNSVPPPPAPSVTSVRPPAPSQPSSIRPPAPPPPAPPQPQRVATVEAPSPEPKRFPWGRVVALVALVGLGMGAYAWARRLSVEPAKVAPSAPFMDRGDEALALHDVRRFSDAVTDYTKALAFNELDADALTHLSRAHAIWAEALENVAQWDAMRATDARVERKRQVANARAQAELALRAKPGDRAAEIAMVDALRLDGAINAARTRLDRVMDTSTRNDAESLRVAALLAAAESDGDLSQALQVATRAVESDPELIRTQILLAKLLLASGDIATARERVRTVLSKHPGHKLAGMLLSVIEAKAVAASTPVPSAAPDAGAPNDAATAPNSASTEVTPAAATEPGPVATASPELPNTYEELIRRGDSLLERGAIKTAKEAFTKALTLRPGAAPALTGLGYIALEKGDAAGAIRSFTPASSAGHGDAFIGLGDAYRQLGRNSEALRAYESYLNRFPSGPRSSIARRQAERLREQVGGAGRAPIGTPSGLPALNDVGETP